MFSDINKFNIQKFSHELAVQRALLLGESSSSRAGESSSSRAAKKKKKKQVFALRIKEFVLSCVMLLEEEEFKKETPREE